MPQTKYLKQNGDVIYPVTLAENVVGLQDVIDLMLDRIYPVGSIYMSVNSTSPATLFGGT